MIRPERPGDADAIGWITTAAFLGSSHRSGTEAAIIAALRKAGTLTLSLVAEEEGEIVGHAAVSPVTIDDGDCGWFGLGPVSVVPGKQRRGLGSALIEAALSLLRENGARGCVVLGDPAYYGRFGFRPDPAMTYPDAPAPYFQRLILAGPPVCGTVRYDASFDAT